MMINDLYTLDQSEEKSKPVVTWSLVSSRLALFTFKEPIRVTRKWRPPPFPQAPLNHTYVIAAILKGQTVTVWLLTIYQRIGKSSRLVYLVS